MAGQGIAKARRSSWLLAQWFSRSEHAASILGPKQRARTSLPAVLPCKAMGTACKSESCIWPHPPGWHPPDRSTDSHTHLWLERQLFEPSPPKTLVKVKLNTKQMLIITEFPQTTLSQLTASSFYLLVMLRSSAPFLPFPCRSIIMSCPCFLVDGSQLPDFICKVHFHPHLSPFLLLVCLILNSLAPAFPNLTVATMAHLALTQSPYKMDNSPKDIAAEI